MQAEAMRVANERAAHWSQHVGGLLSIRLSAVGGILLIPAPSSARSAHAFSAIDGNFGLLCDRCAVRHTALLSALGGIQRRSDASESVREIEVREHHRSITIYFYFIRNASVCTLRLRVTVCARVTASRALRLPAELSSECGLLWK